MIFYSLRHLESIIFSKMGRKTTTEICACSAWCGVYVLNPWNAKPNHYWEILIPKKGICGKFIEKWFKRSQMLRGFIKKKSTEACGLQVKKQVKLLQSANSAFETP